MAHLTPISTPRQTGGDSAPPAAPSAALALAPGAHRPPVSSLYIHVPFCFHKCHYCDFYSIVDTQDRQEPFTDRLIDELAHLAPFAARPLRTIFVGGGTPSLLRPELWQRLAAAIESLFDLSLIRASGAEWTVECNPETVTPELMAIFAGAGVNRVSIGAQSFNPAHLKTLERWHDPANVGRAVELAQRAGIARRSVDLIFGIPGQTADDWLADLRTALSLGTTHLSCYNLTYEPGTAMTARLKAGQFPPPDEDLEADLIRLTHETLSRAGLRRYEVSNFCVPGHESLHNLVYWRQGQWLAAGPSASGHAYAGDGPLAGSFRWKNTPRLGDYLASAGFSPIVELEQPDPSRLLRERVMMGLRLGEGLDGGSVCRDGAALGLGTDRLLAAAAGAERRGLLTISGERWTLTDEGYLFADMVAAELMGTLARGSER